MNRVRSEVVSANSGHIGLIARALTQSGWTVDFGPANGKLARNRQLLRLHTQKQSLAIRLLAFKVTRSSRGREHERRVEITSTYGTGLPRSAGYDDVVIGYDSETGVFVGLDPGRLNHGGPTGNASSFLERAGLARTATAPIAVLLTKTKLFPSGEYQAFFLPQYLGEYLMNSAAIHAGAYNVRGLRNAPDLAPGWDHMPIGYIDPANALGDELFLSNYSITRSEFVRLTNQAMAELRHGPPTRRRAPLSPEEFQAILHRQEENGMLGEQHVLETEIESLTLAGRADLASRVDWVSRRSVGEGYDIASFDATTGRRRCIEVKSTEGAIQTFFMSSNEWRTAERMRDRYSIHCVGYVRSHPSIRVLTDPVSLLQSGTLVRRCGDFHVRITDVG